jgi:prepilin-type processing-associated H-X9-DG protein
VDIYWSEMLQPYMKNRNIGVCPNEINLKTRTVVFLSYCFNRNVQMQLKNPPNPGDPMSDAQIRYPTTTIAISEWAGIDYTGSDWIGPQSYYKNWAVKPLQANGDLRHNGGSNYVFFDGHANWLRPEKTTYNTDCCPPKKPSNGATDVLFYGDGVSPSWGL